MHRQSFYPEGKPLILMPINSVPYRQRWQWLETKYPELAGGQPGRVGLIHLFEPRITRQLLEAEQLLIMPAAYHPGWITFDLGIDTSTNQQAFFAIRRAFDIRQALGGRPE